MSEFGHQFRIPLTERFFTNIVIWPCSGAKCIYVIISFISTPIQSIHSPYLIHNLVYYNVYCRVYVSSFLLFALCRYTTHTLYFHYTVLTFPATLWHQFRTRDYGGNKNKNDYTLWKYLWTHQPSTRATKQWHHRPPIRRADLFLARSVFERYIDIFARFSCKRLLRQKLQKNIISIPRLQRRRRFLIMILSKFGLCVAISRLVRHIEKK